MRHLHGTVQLGVPQLQYGQYDSLLLGLAAQVLRGELPFRVRARPRKRRQQYVPHLYRLPGKKTNMLPRYRVKLVSDRAEKEL